MFRASTSSRPNRIPGTLELEISDPVMLLNEIARRYETTERVLMEYVDNALDDAEALYRENGDRYPYPIAIEIVINWEAGTVSIRDNCRGMSRQLLERIVKNIGESQKRGVTWVNGRFGFGVQAFRAAAESISFETKHQTSSGYSLELQRDQQHGIKEAKRSDDAFPSDSGTGTIVTLTGFDADWHDFSVESVKAEIENHFERLIARPGLSITVSETGQPPLVCLPFDYGLVDGESIQQSLRITHKTESYPVDIHLKVAREIIPHRSVGFFVRGRRINDAAQIKSFMRKSSQKTRLWGHPNLLGYIEVGEIVQPALTRDDFNRTKGRQLCYEAILALEPDINKLIKRINKTSKDKTLVTLENAVSDAISGNVIVKHPPSAPPSQPALAAAPEAVAAPEFSPANQATDPPAIKFVAKLPEPAGADHRASLVDDTIYINIEHPDFQERLATDRQGIPKLTDRLNAYLAGLISVFQLRELAAQLEAKDVTAILEAQVDAIIKLEAALHNNRAALAQNLVTK